MNMMVSTAWQEGCDAYHCQLEFDQNPYPYGSEDWNLWNQGYLFTQEGWEN